MARLTTTARGKLRKSDFAIPSERKYPIEDRSHARNALGRVAANGTPMQKAEVRRAVERKYPGMVKKGK